MKRFLKNFIKSIISCGISYLIIVLIIYLLPLDVSAIILLSIAILSISNIVDKVLKFKYETLWDKEKGI